MTFTFQINTENSDRYTSQKKNKVYHFVIVTTARKVFYYGWNINSKYKIENEVFLASLDLFNGVSQTGCFYF